MTAPKARVSREIATLAPPALLLLVVLQVATRYGVGHVPLVEAGLAVVVTQVLPGALVWRLVRPVHGWLIEDLVLGFCVGAMIAVPSQIAGTASGVHALSGVLPVLLAVVLLAVPRTRARIRSRETAPLPWTWALATTVAAVGPLLAVLSAYIATPLRWKGWAQLYVDAPYHDALTAEVMQHFPPHYPQNALDPLAYHWFAHSWTAQIATTSGVSIDTLLWRFNPALLLVVAPLAIAVAAMRISGRAWAGPAAALLAFALPDVVPWHLSVLSTPLASPFSPTQQLAVPLIGAVVVLVVLRWRGEASRLGLPLLALALVISGGAKGSVLPVVLAGGAVACAACVVMRSWGRLRVVLLDTVLCGVVLVLLDKVMFGGGDGGLSLDYGHDFVATWSTTVVGHPVDPASAAGVVVAILQILTYVLGPVAAFGLLVDRTTRRDPLAWFLFGAGGGGVGAALVLTHPGSSQYYFLRDGEPLIAIAGAWGLVVLLERAGIGVRRAAAGAAVGVVALPLTLLYADSDLRSGVLGAVGALVLLIVLVGAGSGVIARVTRSGLKGAVALGAAAMFAAGTWPAVHAVATWERPPNPVSATPAGKSINFEDVKALRWLRNHSDRSDIVMTNKHCFGAVKNPCDRRQFFIGAFAQREVLVEGWTYSRTASKLYADHGIYDFTDDLFWDQPLIRLNDGFISDPSAAAATKLWGLGVRWVVVWQHAPHARTLAPYAHRVHRGKSLVIYRMVEPG